jgi:hypothetical protein
MFMLGRRWGLLDADISARDVAINNSLTTGRGSR